MRCPNRPSLGIALLSVGVLSALGAEAVALVGTFAGRWRLTDVTRENRFKQWFFGGLGFPMVGVVLLATS